MTRISVLGASGFIGRRLVEHLLHLGHDVTVHLHDEPNPFGSDVRAIQSDVTLPETLAGRFKGCDLVIHLAGCTIARSRSQFFRVNEAGTRNVAQACVAEQTPPRLIYVSSLAAAGPALERPLIESDPPHPVSDYGRSKLAAESFLLAMAHQLQIQIVRPSSVIGDTDPYMLSLYKTAKKGWVFLPGRSQHRYSMIHVDDLVRALTHLATLEYYCRPTSRHSDQADSVSDRGIVFLSHGSPVTFADVANVARDELGLGQTRVMYVPAPLCWGVAAINSLASVTLGMRPLLNIDKMREAMAGEWMCDSRRLCGELGFEFQVSLDQRIRETTLGYREKGWI